MVPLIFLNFGTVPRKVTVNNVLTKFSWDRTVGAALFEIKVAGPYDPVLTKFVSQHFKSWQMAKM